MEIEIIIKPISIEKIKTVSAEMFGNLVKAVVDIDREIMAVFGDLHSDEEYILIKDGSNQQNLWGINIYPELPEDQMIEFDSMINLRPAHGNMTRSVDDPKIQEKIIKIVQKLIK